MSTAYIPDRPIAFHREYARLGAGITGALLLSQAVYWSKRTSNATGWFYKTQEEWTEETALSRHEQETARKRLKSLGILEEKKQGIPCRCFYRVNTEALISALQTSMPESGKLACRNVADKAAGIQQSNTEITTEITAESESAHTNAAPDELQTQNPTPVSQSDLTPPRGGSAAPAAVPAPAPAHQTTLDDNGKPVNTHPLVDDWQPDVDTLTAGLRRGGIPLDVCQCLADDLELRAAFVNNALANPGRSHTANSWNLKLASWLQRDWQKLKRPMTPEAYRLARGLDTDTAAHAQLAAECPLDQIHALWCQHLGNIKPTPPLTDWKRTSAAQALATRWAEGFTAPMQSDASRMRYVDQEDSLGWWDWLFSSISKTESLRSDDWVNLIRLGNPDVFVTVLADVSRPTGSQ